MSKLNLNLDKQLSQGNVIKNYFPDARFDSRLPMIGAAGIHSETAQVAALRQRTNSTNQKDLKYQQSLGQQVAIKREFVSEEQKKQIISGGYLNSDNDTAFEEDEEADVQLPLNQNSRFSSKKKLKPRHCDSSAFISSGARSGFESELDDEDRSSSTYGLYEGNLANNLIKRSKHGKGIGNKHKDPQSYDFGKNTKQNIESHTQKKLQEEEKKGLASLDHNLSVVQEDTAAEGARSSFKPSTMSHGGSECDDEESKR